MIRRAYKARAAADRRTSLRRTVAGLTALLAPLLVAGWVLAPLWLELSGHASDLTGSGLTATSGLPTGHDTAFHVVVARDFALSMKQGVIYPRWVGSMQGGLGAPVFVFYPPLPYVVTGGLHAALDGDTITALAVSATLAVVLAGLVFFLAARGWFGSIAAGWGASLYLLSPYLTLDLFERFALPTVWSYVWLPAVISLSVRCLFADGSSSRWRWLAVVASLQLMTHLVTAVLLAYVLTPLLVAVRLAYADRLWPTPVALRRFVAAALSAVALAAVFLLPMLAMRGEVQLDWIQDSAHGDFQRNFLFRDEAALGYRPAAIGPQVDRASAALAMIAVLVIAISWRSRRSRRRAPLLLAGASLWAFFLQLPASAGLWQLAPGLAWMQFPWRFGGLQGLLVAAAACAHLGRDKESAEIRPRRRWAEARRLTELLVIAAILCLAIPWATRSASDAWRDGSDDIDRRAHQLIVPEYLPKTLEAPGEVTPLTAPIEPSLAGGTLTVVAASSHRLVVDVEAPAGSMQRAELLAGYAFPGWRASIDGLPVTPRVETTSGRLAVAVPEGRHRVELHYAGTAAESWGWLISGLALVWLVVPRFWRSRRRLADVAERP